MTRLTITKEEIEAKTATLRQNIERILQMNQRIYCIDCPFETDNELDARLHRIEYNHATTHTIQPALAEYHPKIKAELYHD